MYSLILDANCWGYAGIIFIIYDHYSIIYFFYSVPIQAQAKDIKPVLSTGIPTGSKALKPQPTKSSGKNTKKQDAGKKNTQDGGTGNAEDKNENTKPQVTHELSMVGANRMSFVDHLGPVVRKLIDLIQD